MISKGQWTRLPFDYELHRRRFSPESGIPSRENQKASPNKSIQRLLKVPILGQVIALISMYRERKRWPYDIYHWQEKKLAFLRVPKNASTTILAAIMQARYPSKDISSLSVYQVHELAKPHLKSELEKGYDCFAITRNPQDRLISCYYDQVRDRDQNSYFSRLYFGIFSDDISFDQFVNRVKYIPVSVIERHIRKQSDCIPENSEIRIFKLEAFNPQIIDFLKKYGVEMGQVIHNKHQGQSEVIVNSVSDSRIKAVYKEDFDRFGYTI